MEISNVINTLEVPEMGHRIPPFQNLDLKGIASSISEQPVENSHLIHEDPLPFQENSLETTFQANPEESASSIRGNSPQKNKKSDKKTKKKKSSHLPNNSLKNGNTPTPSLKRQLELEAYASIVTAFRSQGELTWKKESILQELRNILKISDERHKIEVKRAEESLSSTANKGKGFENFMDESLSSPAESAGEWETSDDERRRKKQKVSAIEKEPAFLTAHPFPSSEGAPGVMKQPKVKSKKKEEDKNKEKKKSTRKKATKPHEGSKVDFSTSSQDVINNLDLTHLVHNGGGVSDEILEAKNSFDLDKLKEVLEREKQRKEEELETLKLQVAST